MRILLTGGSGDLGSLLCQSLQAKGDMPVVLDMVEPKLADVEWFNGSIGGRELVAEALKGVDCVVHIAAWHGIHENNGTKTPEEFHDLNVTGTFNLFEGAAKAGIKNFVFVSSTSVDDAYGIYGHTKLLGEEMARAYANRHDMNVITLRPRAFIPSWNRHVYSNYIEWAKWFMKGAVHAEDVEQSVLRSVEFLKQGKQVPEKAQTFTIDGAYEYKQEDLDRWDAEGPGSTFKKYYPEFYDLAQEYGLDVTRKPKVLGSQDAADVLGYAPTYTMRYLLEELQQFGNDGPPSPFTDAEGKAPKLKQPGR